MQQLPEFSFAFQPIIDTDRRSVHSFEALVRGPKGESAASVLGEICPEMEAEFDFMAHRLALGLAASQGLTCQLNLNLMPVTMETMGNRVIEQAVEMARLRGISPGQLVLEITENKMIHNLQNFVEQAHHGRALGLSFAVDDFGAGYSGLNLLAEFQPDMIKLDMILVRDIHRKGPRQAIVRGILRTCEDLGIDVIAEGVETQDEFEWLQSEGVHLYQGYFLARPAFEKLVYPPSI